MKQIIDISNINDTDPEKFITNVQKHIDLIQNKNQEVEVQYSTNVLSTNQLVLSALIISRKETQDYKGW